MGLFLKANIVLKELCKFKLVRISIWTADLNDFQYPMFLILLQAIKNEIKGKKLYDQFIDFFVVRIFFVIVCYCISTGLNTDSTLKKNLCLNPILERVHSTEVGFTCKFFFSFLKH